MIRSRVVADDALAEDGNLPVPVTFISSDAGVGGGAEAQMLALIDSLDRRWVRSAIVLGDGPIVGALRDRGIVTESVPDFRRLELGFRAAPRVRRMLRQSGARVVHANNVRAAIVASIACFGTRRRVLWLKVDCGRDGLLAQLIAAGCDQVIGVSRTVTETFRGPLRRRVHVVYPGVEDWNFDRGDARRRVIEELGCAPDAEVVVVSARLGPLKGQLDLIEVLQQLLREYPNLRVAFLGGETATYPGYGAFLRRRCAELGVAESVSFLGLRSEESAVEFVCGSDVLVAPSRYEPESGWKEGFGLSPVEAMWVGTPVVAYRHGSFPEILGDAALFAPEGDGEALAAAVARVIGDRALRDRLVARGAERVRSRYGHETMVEGMKARYLAAAARR